MSGQLASVGDTVRVKRPLYGMETVGTVEHVGTCGWPRCKHGPECTTIRLPYRRGGSTTVNLTPAQYDIESV